jgi:hypothetical protein
MTRLPQLEWMNAGVEAWMLALEASTVIALRTARIAAGGALADRELQLMWSEKVQAALEWQLALMTGGLGATALSGTRETVRHYRGKVRANRRRLG